MKYLKPHFYDQFVCTAGDCPDTCCAGWQILIDEDSPMMSGAKANKTGAGKIRMSKSATISPEINLIGKTTDEAIALLDKYLDDAYLSHLGSVRIVHGKGTGALRNAVHTYLKRQKHVKSYHLGEYGEGDAGVTIAEFK